MLPRHSHAENTAKIRLTVTDGLGVQRTLTMLTGRNHHLTRFEAEEAGAGQWRISLDLLAGPEQVRLIAARLHRMPSVLSVAVQVGGALAATA